MPESNAMRRVRRQALYGYLILLVALAVGLFEYSNGQSDKLWRTQLAACSRGNVIRAESNRRVHGLRVAASVLSDFLATAGPARRAGGTPADIRAADEYRRQRARIATVRFGSIPLVNCKRAVPRP